MLIFRSFVITVLAGLAFTAQAAGIESFVGKSPSRLLKQEKSFAKAYTAAVKDAELPDWTRRAAVGFPAEAIALDGKTLILVSACNPKDCLDERLYALYEAEDQSITGFFFLPPDPSNPSDTRIAFSRWFGKMPSKPRSDWLLERAMTDLQPANTLPKQ